MDKQVAEARDKIASVWIILPIEINPSASSENDEVNPFRIDTEGIEAMNGKVTDGA